MGGPMNDLIERIEAASGPDREIDAEIAETIGWDVRYDRSDPNDREPYYQPVAERSWTAVPAYTASIDAALTLVPEWFEWSLEYQAGHHVSSDVECMVAIAKLGDPCRDWESESYTPALALCAAALKARAYLKETNNAD